MPDDNDKPDDVFFNFTPDGVEDLMNETSDDFVPNPKPELSAQERLEAHARMLTQLGPCPQLTGEGHRELSELIKAAEAEKRVIGEDQA